MVEYLYHGFLFISLILIFFGIRSYRITVDLLKNGILTLAKVVAIRTSYDEKTYYHPVFEYKDSNGTIIEFESEVGSGSSPFEIGESVSILYSEETNKRKLLDFWGLYRWPILFFSFAFPFFIMGLGHILFSAGWRF